MVLPEDLQVFPQNVVLPEDLFVVLPGRPGFNGLAPGCLPQVTTYVISFQVCGCLWRIASDDFVFPALLETVARLAGLAVLVGVLVFEEITPAQLTCVKDYRWGVAWSQTVQKLPGHKL